MIYNFQHNKLKKVENSKMIKMMILIFQHLNIQNLKTQNQHIFLRFQQKNVQISKFSTTFVIFFIKKIMKKYNFLYT